MAFALGTKSLTTKPLYLHFCCYIIFVFFFCRLLDLFNIPTIEEQTNIGEKIGATWTHDGVEFGRKLEAFKGYTQNT